MTTTIPRHLRAWDTSRELQREMNDDARGWEPDIEPDDPERDPDIYGETCPCGSGLPADDEDGGCVACWFARVYRVRT